jgi:hypothetical protein
VEIRRQSKQKKLVELGNFSRRRHLHLPGLVRAQKVPPADI